MPSYDSPSHLLAIIAAVNYLRRIRLGAERRERRFTDHFASGTRMKLVNFPSRYDLTAFTIADGMRRSQGGS